jgi:pheromone shutdown-related protein TraB
MLNEITKVKVNGKEIILVGTAHVSKKSVELVKKSIEEEKPDLVAIELCKDRYKALVNKKKWDETEITKVIKSGKTHLFLLQLLLTNFQRKIGDELGIKPGSEMLKAIKIAKENKIPVKLVDRNVRITLKRAFNLMSLKEKFKLLFSFVSGIFSSEEIDEETIEKMKESDVLTEMMEDLGKEIPSIKKVVVDERDTYIASKILSSKKKKILAVVGAGHVSGIKKNLENLENLSEEKDELKNLEKIPEKKSFLKYIWYLIPLVFIIILGWAFYTRGADLTLNLFTKWFLINGILAALGVLIALGHPLSILTAFLAAPFTSLHPAVAAGWFSGLVELWVRKPKVKDFEGLLKIDGITDLWRNGVTRILLVIAFANLGSSLGTFIALPYLASLL